MEHRNGEASHPNLLLFLDPSPFHVSLSANGTSNQPGDQGAWAFACASSILCVTVTSSSGLPLLFASSPCWTTATTFRSPKRLLRPLQRHPQWTSAPIRIASNPVLPARVRTQAAGPPPRLRSPGPGAGPVSLHCQQVLRCHGHRRAGTGCAWRTAALTCLLPSLQRNTQTQGTLVL